MFFFNHTSKTFFKFALDKALPKGSVLRECGSLVQRAHYRILVFNSQNFKKSMHYNPFAYIHSEKYIMKLVTTLISNTKSKDKGGGD